jgi:ankyrin repeat protein
MSVIGVTIGESYRITACHLKNDENHTSKIIDTLKKWSIPKEAMQPMTKEEIEARKRRIEASKQIIKENLPIADIEKYLEAGANPNAQNGKPLENAVRENNKEKVELLIKKGAVPTLNNPIKFAKDLDMIKILVKNGCELTNEVLNTIINDLEAMKFVLQNGIDANFEKGYPLRAASRNQNLDVVKLLVAHGANVAERRYMVVKQCIEYATNEILKYLLDELESGDANFKNPVAKQKLFAEWIGWCSTSLQTTPEQKEEVVEILKSYE